MGVPWDRELYRSHLQDRRPSRGKTGIEPREAPLFDDLGRSREIVLERGAEDVAAESFEDRLLAEPDKPML